MIDVTPLVKCMLLHDYPNLISPTSGINNIEINFLWEPVRQRTTGGSVGVGGGGNVGGVTGMLQQEWTVLPHERRAMVHGRPDYSRSVNATVGLTEWHSSKSTEQPIIMFIS